MPSDDTATSDVFGHIVQSVDEALIQAEALLRQLNSGGKAVAEVEDDGVPVEEGLSSERNCSPDPVDSPPPTPRRGSKEKKEQQKVKMDAPPPTPDPDPLASPPTSPAHSAVKSRAKVVDPLASPPTSPPSTRNSTMKIHSPLVSPSSSPPTSPPTSESSESWTSGSTDPLATPPTSPTVSVKKKMPSRSDDVAPLHYKFKSYLRLDRKAAVVMAKFKSEKHEIDDVAVTRIERMIQNLVGTQMQTAGTHDSYIDDLMKRK